MSAAGLANGKIKKKENAQWVSLFTLDVTVALVVQKAFYPEVQQDEFHI